MAVAKKLNAGLEKAHKKLAAKKAAKVARAAAASKRLKDYWAARRAAEDEDSA